METITYELLRDVEVDRLSYKHTFSYYESNSMDILVHYSTGSTNPTAFSKLYIPGSHLHHRFFRIYSFFKGRTDQYKNHFILTSFSLREVNQLLKLVKSGNVNCPDPLSRIARQIDARLSPDEIQSLPIEFVGVRIPMDFPSISFIHRGLLCTISKDISLDTTRFHFQYTVFPVVGETNCFEIPIRKPHSMGMSTMPLLSIEDRLAKTVEQVIQYLCQKMCIIYDHDTWQASCRYIANLNVCPTFPKYSGETGYGDDCQTLSDLFLFLMPIIKMGMLTDIPSWKLHSTRIFLHLPVLD